MIIGGVALSLEILNFFHKMAEPEEIFRAHLFHSLLLKSISGGRVFAKTISALRRNSS
jgi:hypothetical protein